jgi:hypothetical protein
MPVRATLDARFRGHDGLKVWLGLMQRSGDALKLVPQRPPRNLGDLCAKISSLA